MNKKKTNIILVCIFILFSAIFWREFLAFQESKSIGIKKETKIENRNFSVEKIRELKETDIFTSPDEKILTDFVEKINKAKKEVKIEVYMFTEKRILQALKNAKKRWVSVKVILEKTPYMTSNINKNHFEELKKFGIKVVWSNQKNYYLNHTKFYIIDDLAIISTWNLTYSTFKTNKEFFIFTKDETILKTLNKIFDIDFSGEKNDFYDENIVSSPNYSREKLEKLLSSANKNIKIYIQYLKDEKINNLLIKLKKEKKLDIEIILDKKQKEDKNTEFLQKKGIKISFYNWKTMHSKAILVDEKYLFIWSINFSEASIDKNRELWILISNKEIIKKFNEIFKKDF